ncbi:MAG TPA: prepilin-type N-terminal cleavage/methylation domain-containing protein [Candidatus Saccharimonadales bacterium]
MNDRNQSAGFTVVEIVIAIVVIGILASMAVIGLGEVAKQSRDTKRRTDMETLTKAMTSWANDNGKTPIQTGAGYAGLGHGYVTTSDPDYPKSIDKLLQEGGYLGGDVKDPKKPSDVGAYMFYACASWVPTNKVYGFFAKLEAPTAKDTATVTKWQGDGCYTEPLDPYYGMNYVRVFTYDN